MMLSKLAIGNVKKSFKDYSIYFLTLTFAVCIFYMFNSLESQQELMEVTKLKHDAMKALSEVLGYMSVFVSVVLGFLIVYANNFLIKRRKKELGIYMTLGMEKSKISMILILETLFIGVFALLVGLVAGIVLSQVMSIFTAKMFEMDMTAFKFIFSIKATLKAMSYFGIIFLIVMIFNFISVNKCKLIDLLYAENKNEALKTKNIAISITLFILSIISLIIAYYLILTNGMVDINIYFTLSIVFGGIGTLLFFMSLSGFMLKLAQCNKGLYLKNLNMFVIKQINNKINTTYISMSVICIVLLFAIGTFSSGMSLSNVISQSLKESTPFDNSFFYYNYSEGQNEKVNDIYSALNKEYPLDDKVDNYEQHTIYEAEETYDSILSSDYKNTNFDLLGDTKIEVIGISDYNELLKIQDKGPITLGVNEFAINSGEEFGYLFKPITEDNKGILISKKKLNLGINEILDIEFSNSIGVSNIPIIIVNDELLGQLDISYSILNMNYKDSVDAVKFDEDMKDIKKNYYEQNNDQKEIFTYNTSKVVIYLGSISTKAIVTFIAIYLGFVFLVTCVAILALQQLSEAADNKKRYDLLRKIGAEKSMVNNALFSQILIYFLMPLGLAIVHSVVGLTAANNVIKLFGKIDLWSSIMMTTGFFVVIYGGYFIATYIGCKNIILKN